MLTYAAKCLIVFIVQQVTCLSYHDPLTMVLGCVQEFEESTPDYVFGRRHVGAWTFYYLHFAGEVKKGTLALS